MRKLIVLLIILSLYGLPIRTAQAKTTGEQKGPAEAAPRIPVYFSGPAESSVRTAIELADDFQIVADAAQAKVLVLHGEIPEPVELRTKILAGAGAVLILGAESDREAVETLLGVQIGIEMRQEALSLVPAMNYADPLVEMIAWNSAPQVRERMRLESPSSSLTPLVLGYEDNSLVMGKQQTEQSTIFLMTPFLDGTNPQLQEWGYYNYLVYHLVKRAAGENPVPFGRYPAAPLPQASQRMALLAFLSGALALALAVFWIVRRYSRRHPELLDVLVADRVGYETRQAQTDWEEIGFHRPLGGFLLAFMLGLVVFVPLIIYQNLILPVYILPSAQALGIWGRVVQLFEVLWLLLDMGTSTAFIKFFSQHRVHDPRKAIQYGQVFIWWQALSGAVQVAVVTGLAGFILPQTAFALYAWSVILHTMIQLPGFYLVMRHALMGWQRFDYAQLLDICWKVIFPFITQPIFVILFIIWGSTNPIYGRSMGGLIGLGVAAYATEALVFLTGLWLYRRLGYNVRLLFLAHFDWQTVKNAFRFGVFEMLGSVAWATGQALEILITQARLVNYTEIWGNWGLAQNFVFAYQVISNLFASTMPAISEAFSHARTTLSQYYAAMMYKYGGMVSGFIAAVLLAVADRFILGASGPEFVRAAAYAVPMIIWGAFQYPSWVGDEVQLASNRPYLKTALIAGEQAVRILLVLFLMPRFQVYALIIAYFIGLLSKDITAYFINHRVCFPQRFYAWQSLAAPVFASSAHFLILRQVTGWIWQGDQITSVLIFLVGILLSFPLYAFFYGLFGGWDEATLTELHQASRLSNFMRPLAWLFWAANSMGARLSPIHGRFPITIRPAALAEAKSLRSERVQV